MNAQTIDSEEKAAAPGGNTRTTVRLLVVEDETRIADFVRRGLESAGYAVDVAGDGLKTVELVHSNDYDLILLDLMLPDIDGVELLKKIRNRKSSPPVLILSARDAVDDRVKGLELGADDYLVKPFAFSELLARLRSILRRGQVREFDILRADDLVVDVVRRRVTRNDQRIDLSAKEYALLDLLIRRKGEVLSRTLIAEQVWDMNFDSDTSVIEVAVRRLSSWPTGSPGRACEKIWRSGRGASVLKRSLTAMTIWSIPVSMLAPSSRRRRRSYLTPSSTSLRNNKYFTTSGLRATTGLSTSLRSG